MIIIVIAQLGNPCAGAGAGDIDFGAGDRAELLRPG
jgi:hypothetical protein